jgi:hypothetical protein
MWAPPLDPPTAGGLDADAAQSIANATWATDPHLCAALMWEAYAATLPPAPAMAQVSTGVQSVSYSPPVPGGDYGAAMSRAAWHRSLMDTLVAVPTVVAPATLTRPWPGGYDPFWGGGWGPPPVLPPTGDTTASFTYDPPGPAPGSPVTLDGSLSQGSNGSAVTRYDWAMSWEGGSDAVADAAPPTPVITWTTPAGSQAITVTLTITDEAHLTATASQVIQT